MSTNFLTSLFSTASNLLGMANPAEVQAPQSISNPPAVVAQAEANTQPKPQISRQQLHSFHKAPPLSLDNAISQVMAILEKLKANGLGQQLKAIFTGKNVTISEALETLSKLRADVVPDFLAILDGSLPMLTQLVKETGIGDQPVSIFQESSQVKANAQGGATLASLLGTPAKQDSEAEPPMNLGDLAQLAQMLGGLEQASNEKNPPAKATTPIIQQGPQPDANPLEALMKSLMSKPAPTTAA